MTTPRAWRNRRVVGVGEAMVEFAPVGDNLFRRGFAGDTLNTCWHIAQLLGEPDSVSYYTRVGVDPMSDAFVSFLLDSGVDASRIARDPERAIGLYLISLKGAERSFSYWRDSSAARGLADDIDLVRAGLGDAGLIHVSGITLAILGDAGRRNLVEALGEARAAGAIVSFDPNVRLRLWRDRDEIRRATEAMWRATDIALPSFDDEAAIWGDANPAATLARIAAAGVDEIVVKNGAGDVAVRCGGIEDRAPTPTVTEVRDTTGAGDSFNAGYLYARLSGVAALDAVAFGQRVAGVTIGHYGALAPKDALALMGKSLRRRS